MRKDEEIGEKQDELLDAQPMPRQINSPNMA